MVGWFGRKLYTGGAEWKRSLLMTVEFTMASIQLNMLLIVLHAFSVFADVRLAHCIVRNGMYNK